MYSDEDEMYPSVVVVPEITTRGPFVQSDGWSIAHQSSTNDVHPNTSSVELQEATHVHDLSNVKGQVQSLPERTEGSQHPTSPRSYCH